MAKKDYYLIIDTETTMTQKVADFGAVLCDRKGKVIKQCAVLLAGIYNNMEEHPLFFTSDRNGIWAKKGIDKRYEAYDNMLNSGSRMLASVAAVNSWLNRVQAEFSPYITAYNFPFDRDKCHKTEIDLTIFGDNYFCLWAASADKWASTKRYRQFIVDNHAFNTPTGFGNMTYQTNAEVMARFVLNSPELPDEPHTALEDVLYYELPILKRLLASTPKHKIIEAERYNWRNFQVKDAFTAK